MLKTLKQIIFPSIFIFFILFLCVTCSSEYWGLNNFQKILTLEQRSEQDKIEINFISNLTSDNYKIELFYPDIQFERYHAFSIKDSILQSLDGFILEVYDPAKNILLNKRIIDYKNQGHRENFFLEGKVLTLPLITKLSVFAHKTYKLKLIIPPRKYFDKRINNPILGGGVSPPASP